MLVERPGPVNAPARRDRILLIAVGLILFGWRLGAHDLWPPDEPRFALVARAMAESGDPIVLSFHDRLYTDKPPLFFWAVNLAARLTGSVDEWAVRLPSAAAAIGALLIVHLIGTWLYDRRAGVVSALVFATALQIAERARWGSIDMTLNLFVLAAIALFLRGRLRPEVRSRSFLLAWGCMGLGTLAKGPVGLLLPILATVPLALFDRGSRPAIRRMFPPAGIALFLGVVAAWYLPFTLRVGPAIAFGEVLWHQNVDRYREAWNATHPVWFYLWRFPIGFFPWIVFLPAAIGHAFSTDERDRRRAAVFLSVWALAILVFFSFSSAKRGVYIIPAYPAVSILVGRLISGEGRRLRLPLAAWTLLAAILAATLPILAGRKAPGLAPIGAAIGGLFLAGSLAAWRERRRGRAGRAAALLVGSIVLSHLAGIGWLAPWVNRHQNIRATAEAVRARLDPDATFATTEQKHDAWVFYTGRPAVFLDDPPAALRFLQEAGRRELLIEDAELDPIRDRLPEGVVELLRGRVGSQDYFLLRRGGAPGADVP
jgi:4-amino-4-deoxy-L-arabinose transferase-like glycosyltransferase